MTFGLLSSMYKTYRIDNETKEGFRSKKAVKNFIGWPSMGAAVILEILLTILAILCLFDIAQTKTLDTWLVVLILVLFFIPYIGDIIALVLIIYWVIEVRPTSTLLKKL